MSHLTLTGPALAAYQAYKRLGGTMWLYNKMERNQMYGKFKYAPNAKLTSGVFRWDGKRMVEVKENRGLTGSQLARVANPARQRQKGPLVRFGRKYT